MYKTKRPITNDYKKYLDRKRATALETIEVKTLIGNDSTHVFARSYPFWYGSVTEQGYAPIECSLFSEEGQEFLMTGVFQDPSQALTGGYCFILGSHKPVKMARFLWHSYPRIIEYYVEKYGKLWATACARYEQPNSLLRKGGFAFLYRFEYNGIEYNTYRIGPECLRS